MWLPRSSAMASPAASSPLSARRRMSSSASRAPGILRSASWVRSRSRSVGAGISRPPEGATRADPEAPVGGEAEELGILEQPSAAWAVVLDDHALHLIEEDLVGHAAERGEGPLETQHDGERRLARHELDREHPRVAED